MDLHNRRAKRYDWRSAGNLGGLTAAQKSKGIHWRTYGRKMAAKEEADAVDDLVLTQCVYRRFPEKSLDNLLE